MATPQSQAPKISALTSGVQLTPVSEGHARPSHSPIKSPAVSHPLKSSQSMFFRGSKPRIPKATYDLPTAALEFEEFSYLGKDGSLAPSNVPLEYHDALAYYLQEHFDAEIIDRCEPFLVIGCKGDPPAEDERPFTVAGLIAIWRRSDDMELVPIVGSSGNGEYIDIDVNMLSQIRAREVPPREVILYLANKIFPTCQAISLLWETLVVELPTMSDEEFHNTLLTMPRRIKKASVMLTFHNGPLPGTDRRRRAIQPKPIDVNDEGDETDYVDKDGKFYPGAMIASRTPKGDINSMITAGVLIERAGKQRLTCSYHCWADQDAENKLGGSDPATQKIFAVQQGDKPGNVVGFLREHIDDTDIALAQILPHITFDNQFMDMDYRPKRFVHSAQERIGNDYVFDSFTTGKQKVKGFGRRFLLGRVGHSNAYIAREQGVFASNSLLMAKPPFIRHGICGSVLLKCTDMDHQEDDEDTVMTRGEIVGMMHFADFVSKDPRFAASYLCYADSFDPLLVNGWKIVQVPDSPTSASPPKKQKLDYEHGSNWESYC
jgi:hypothetical protein